LRKPTEKKKSAIDIKTHKRKHEGEKGQEGTGSTGGEHKMVRVSSVAEDDRNRGVSAALLNFEKD